MTAFRNGIAMVSIGEPVARRRLVELIVAILIGLIGVWLIP